MPTKPDDTLLRHNIIVIPLMTKYTIKYRQHYTILNA